MSTKNNKSKTIKQLLNNFIKSEITLLERTKAYKEIQSLECEKLSLINKLTQISVVNLDSTTSSGTLSLTEEENFISKEITLLNNKIRDVHLSVDRITVNIANALTSDLLFKYSKLLSSLNLSVESFSNFCDTSLTNKNFLSDKINLVNPVNIFDFLSDIKDNNNSTTSYLTNKSLNRRVWFSSKRKKSFFFFRRIFKRIKSLKKIKKTFIFSKKNKVKSIPISFNFISIFLKVTEFHNNNLFKRIPLTQRIVLRNNLEFFYRLHRKIALKIKDLTPIDNLNNFKSYGKKLKIFLRNFHQKPYWKLRLARITHWSLFTTKTIRKQRYKSFFKKFIKNYQKLSYNFFFFINFFMKTALSWTRLGNAESFFKYNLVEKIKSVIKLPLLFLYKFNWRVLIKKSFFIKKKIGKWSYLNYKRSQFPWLQRKKNSPKGINHTQPNKVVLMSISNWDILTNTIFIHKNVDPFVFQTKDNFKTNWQIKLNLYRYNSNNQCLLLLHSFLKKNKNL